MTRRILDKPLHDHTLLQAICRTKPAVSQVAADMAMKERALAKTAPPRIRTGRFRPGDWLLAAGSFLSRASAMSSSRALR